MVNRDTFDKVLDYLSNPDDMTRHEERQQVRWDEGEDVRVVRGIEPTLLWKCWFWRCEADHCA